ncbi:MULTISPECIES: nucleotidyltransferase family protein [Cryobacterium]|uniref:Nucleotidyltransferase family protein n=1 Tax=Cryobacterium breve TaxID=1259258 RepID=A0ABY2J1M6_9MICO|nr:MULTISPECIES: nucleotidyltransferase family protein [Cryobacterium]TFC93880.1 nucleotidyltransferase family protein [Cryobacterium sp. TmT3-12]TFC97618.1 nucleotidyltransferase family protein [Cryobacterium breve]
MPTFLAPIAGLVLAAGAGSRYGMPKALAQGDDGTLWLVRTIGTLTDAGCSPVIVVLGAQAAEARALLDDFGLIPSVVVAQADDWAEGLSASLRAGLRQATALPSAPIAVAIVPVDVPGLRRSTVARLIGTLPDGTGTGTWEVGPHTLRQAEFDARPGHPVVIGRAHWAELIGSATGDTGARPYLRSHEPRLVDCTDLETGLDVDTRD